MGVTPAGMFGFGPLLFVSVIKITPPLIFQVPANVLVSGFSFQTLKYEKVPSGEIVMVLVKVSVPPVLVPSCFQTPGIFLVSFASRLQPVSRKLNAKNMIAYFIVSVMLPNN